MSNRIFLVLLPPYSKGIVREKTLELLLLFIDKDRRPLSAAEDGIFFKQFFFQNYFLLHSMWNTKFLTRFTVNESVDIVLLAVNVMIKLIY